ncbi:energy-coupling factor ABC transporter permease [Ectothiorhodospiraceae bacterium WFHF3C12]|nr:energy-coupling factor ABC transporter permease [Ectothiorhodospiraceae bacterium WFHF3C12]
MSGLALPAGWWIALWVMGALALLSAARFLPYRVLWNSPTAQHLFFAACLGLTLLWSVRAGITPGLGVHFLGVTALTLMVGWPLAIVATLVASGLNALFGLIEPSLVPFEFVLNGVVPVAVSHWVRLVLERLFPPHLFVYLLGCGFAGGVLAGLASRGATAAVLVLAAAYSGDRVAGELGVIMALTTLPEGVINGMIVTVMAVYRPEWVKEFDDSRYLG